MKRIIVCLLLMTFSCSGKSGLDIMQCNPLRQSKNKTVDMRISELTKRIKALEDDEERKAKNPLLLGDLYVNLGGKYLDRSLWDQAIKAFNNALKNGRINQMVYYSLGLAHGNRGKMNNNEDDINKAQSYYEKSLELEPDYYYAGYALAILLFFEKKEKEKAISILEGIASRHKSFYAGRFALGKFYFETDEKEKSLRTYESLQGDLERSPDSAVILEYRAQCKENISQLKSQL